MLVTLDEAICLYAGKNTLNTPVNELSIYRDSVIKRLSYCLEGLWQLISFYCKAASTPPTNIIEASSLIHAAIFNKIIGEKELTALLQLIEIQSKIPYGYYNDIADEIAKHAPKAYGLMHTILDRLHQNAMV